MDEDLKELIVKADNGDVEAMVMVAGCYNSGFGTGKDEAKAHIYYRRAADRGNVVAAYLAGMLWRNGYKAGYESGSEVHTDGCR